MPGLVMDCYHRAVNDGVADMPNLLEALLLICIRTAYLSRFAHHSPGGSLRSNCRLIQMPDPKEKEKKRKEMLRIREMERPSRIYPSLLIALVVIPSRPFSLSFLFPFPPLKVVPDAESQSSSPIKTDSFFVFLRKTPQVPYIAYWTITATTINENCTQILYPTDS